MLNLVNSAKGNITYSYTEVKVKTVIIAFQKVLQIIIIDLHNSKSTVRRKLATWQCACPWTTAKLVVTPDFKQHKLLTLLVTQIVLHS